MPTTLARPIALAALAARDGAQRALTTILPARPGVPQHALEAAVAWLCRSHDATGRRGSSKGFSLLQGWAAAYPETTGYVIGSFLAYGTRRGDRSDLVQRAREMGDWERAIQQPDGG